jgi:hypothetical protein
MTQFLTATLLLLVSLVTASGGDKATPESSQVWTPPHYAKVIGYRFRLPGENSKEAVPSGFTLLPDGLLDSALLAKQKTKSAELKPADIRRLTSAINAAKVVSQAACYDPHHIFVFYSDAGTVVAAIEVCFGCTGVSAVPAVAKPRWGRHDFIALAKLTHRLGLWDEPRTLQQWLDLQSDDEPKPKKP